MGWVSISPRPGNDNVNLGLDPDILQNTDTIEVTVGLNTTKEHESTKTKKEQSLDGFVTK